jgi:glycosyltransferase involved in cell wall biosynthesis
LLLPFVLGRRGIPVVQTWHEPLSWLRGVRYLPCALTKDALITVEPEYGALLPKFVWKLLLRKPFLTHIPVAAMIPKTELTTVQRESIKQRFGATGRNLVVYFGYAIESKGIEDLFRIADPATDRLVLLCELDHGNHYHRQIARLMNAGEWSGKAFSTGYLPAAEVAEILAAADAAVFPFTGGMTGRNTSVYAARSQGTFVLTTSRDRSGYDESENSCYTPPGDLENMRVALRRHVGHRSKGRETIDWPGIASLHLNFYRRRFGVESADKLVNGEM